MNPMVDDNVLNPYCQIFDMNISTVPKIVQGLGTGLGSWGERLRRTLYESFGMGVMIGLMMMTLQDCLILIHTCLSNHLRSQTHNLIRLSLISNLLRNKS